MTLYIANAFSLSMLPPAEDHSILLFEDATFEKAREFAAQPHTSCVGHADTARLMSNELGVQIDAHRCSVTLEPGDQILVAQYSGPRLPEGAVELPAGASFRWIFVLLPRTTTCPYCQYRNYGKGWHCAGCGAC